MDRPHRPKAPRANGAIPSGLIVQRTRGSPRGRPRRPWTRSSRSTLSQVSTPVASHLSTALTDNASVDELDDAHDDQGSKDYGWASITELNDDQPSLADTFDNPECREYAEWEQRVRTPHYRVAETAKDGVPATRPLSDGIPLPAHFPHTPTAGLTLTGWLRSRRNSLKGYDKTVVPLNDLHREFARQKNDYLVKKIRMFRGCSIRWLSGPGMRAADILARHFVMSIDPKHKHKKDAVVLRAIYRCNGSCGEYHEHEEGGPQHPLLGGADSLAEEMVWSAAQRIGSGDDRNVERKSYREVPRIRPHKARLTLKFEDDEEDVDESVSSSCNVEAVVEMTVDQVRAGVCTIYMMNSRRHPQTSDTSYLRVSPYVRRMLHQAASGYGMSAGRMNQWWNDATTQSDPEVIWLKTHAPWRLPSPRDLSQAVVTASKKTHVHADALAGVAILCKRHPEAFLAAQFPEYVDGTEIKEIDPSSRFQCVIATREAVLTAILQTGEKGMYCDTSHKNMTAMGLPFTVLSTINNKNRMIPVATMISDRNDIQAYTFLLETFKRACEHAAYEYVHKINRPDVLGALPHDIEAACRDVLDSSSGYQPRFMMVDAADAEIGAIRRVFPHVTIRLCQFHLVRACRSRIRRILGTARGAELKTQSVLNALRTCQRCPAEAEWSEYYRNFELEVNRIAEDTGQVWQQFDEYLQREWFSESHRKMTVDYGLPAHVSRDGPWSTNNYAEAAFLTFAKLFLGLTANKRSAFSFSSHSPMSADLVSLDRLVAILINNYFPFYANTPPNQSRADPFLISCLFGGREAWDRDRVHVCPLPLVPANHRLKFKDIVYSVIDFANGVNGRSRTFYCGEHAVGGRDWCTCDGWRRTGKFCSHVWAVRWLELCGPVQDFEENTAVIREFLSSRKRIRAVSEHDGETDFVGEDRLDRLRSWDENFGDLGDLGDIILDPPVSGKTPVTPARNFASINLTGNSAQQSEPPSAPPKPRIVISPSPERLSPDVSPIGRRFQNVTDEAGSWPWQPSAESAPAPPFDEYLPETEHEPASELPDYKSWSRAAPGRPGFIRPNDPNRKPGLKGSRSTLGLPASFEQKLARQRPVGVRNTGADCYITSVLQTLTRTEPFIKAFDETWPFIDLQAHLQDPVVEQLLLFRQALVEREAQTVPHMRHVMAESEVVESEGQEDPRFFLDKLLLHLDAIREGGSDDRRFQDLFAFHVAAFAECPSCGEDSWSDPDSFVQSAMYIRPTPAEGRTPDKHISDMIVAAVEDGISSHSHLCQNATCGQSFDAAAKPMVNNCGPLMCLNLNWSEVTADELPWTFGIVAGATGEVDITTEFPLAERFVLDKDLASGPDALNEWHLRGVICRSGRSLQSAHNFGIIRLENTWWIVDDHRVEYAHSPTEAAWAGNSFPLMLIYARRLYNTKTKKMGAIPKLKRNPWQDKKSVRIDGLTPDEDAPGRGVANDPNISPAPLCEVQRDTSPVERTDPTHSGFAPASGRSPSPRSPKFDTKSPSPLDVEAFEALPHGSAQSDIFGEISMIPPITDVKSSLPKTLGKTRASSKLAQEISMNPETADQSTILDKTAAARVEFDYAMKRRLQRRSTLREGKRLFSRPSWLERGEKIKGLCENCGATESANFHRVLVGDKNMMMCSACRSYWHNHVGKLRPRHLWRLNKPEPDKATINPATIGFAVAPAYRKRYRLSSGKWNYSYANGRRTRISDSEASDHKYDNFDGEGVSDDSDGRSDILPVSHDGLVPPAPGRPAHLRPGETMTGLCHHCGETESYVFKRRMVDGKYMHLCTRCYDRHLKYGKLNILPPPESRPPGLPRGTKMEGICHNCPATQSSLFRRTKINGEFTYLCSACYSYYRKHGSHRPPEADMADLRLLNKHRLLSSQSKGAEDAEYNTSQIGSEIDADQVVDVESEQPPSDTQDDTPDQENRHSVETASRPASPLIRRSQRLATVLKRNNNPSEGLKTQAATSDSETTTELFQPSSTEPETTEPSSESKTGALQILSNHSDADSEALGGTRPQAIPRPPQFGVGPWFRGKCAECGCLEASRFENCEVDGIKCILCRACATRRRQKKKGIQPKRRSRDTRRLPGNKNQCRNCGTTDSPNFGKMLVDGQPQVMCGACSQYYRKYNFHRPTGISQSELQLIGRRLAAEKRQETVSNENTRSTVSSSRPETIKAPKRRRADIPVGLEARPASRVAHDAEHTNVAKGLSSPVPENATASVALSHRSRVQPILSPPASVSTQKSAPRTRAQARLPLSPAPSAAVPDQVPAQRTRSRRQSPHTTSTFDSGKVSPSRGAQKNVTARPLISIDTTSQIVEPRLASVSPSPMASVNRHVEHSATVAAVRHRKALATAQVDTPIQSIASVPAEAEASVGEQASISARRSTSLEIHPVAVPATPAYPVDFISPTKIVEQTVRTPASIPVKAAMPVFSAARSAHVKKLWVAFFDARKRRAAIQQLSDSDDDIQVVDEPSPSKRRRIATPPRRREKEAKDCDRFPTISDDVYVDMVIQRYRQLKVFKGVSTSAASINPSNQRPLPSKVFDTIRLRLATFFPFVEGGIPTSDSMGDLPYESIDLFQSATEWWNTGVNDAIVLACQRNPAVTSSSVLGPTARVDVRYQPFLLGWDIRGTRLEDTTSEPMVDGRGDTLPWPRLGRDRSWRDRITISVINVSPNGHFAALAIFGPAKLVVVFDGAGGAWDDPHLHRRWRTLLADRRNYEHERGWVSKLENSDWLEAPNIPSLRDKLGWAVQPDGNNCGPLAVAACIHICEGLRPSWKTLGFNANHPNAIHMLLLRHSLIVALLWDSLSVTARQNEAKGRRVRQWLNVPSVIAALREASPVRLEVTWHVPSWEEELRDWHILGKQVRDK